MRHRIHEKSTDALVFDSGRIADRFAPRSRRRREGPTSGVTAADIAAGLADPTRWLTFSGDYSGARHSPLKQITPRNVASAQGPQWTFQSGTYARGRGFETTPLALDGVLYVTGPNGYAWAIDARTGRPFWEYRRTLAGRSHVRRQCAREPRLRHLRRAAVHGDARRALARARSALRRRALGRRARGLSHRLRGDAGAARRRRQGHRRHLGRRISDARLRRCLRSRDRRADLALLHRARTRRARQRHLAGHAERGARRRRDVDDGQLRPELGLLYWGTGNPNPDFYGADRHGDNLYTDSLLAIEAATGKLRWHYQFTPHDTHDWDSNHVPVQATLPWNGGERRVVMVANRNGFFYVHRSRDRRALARQALSRRRLGRARSAPTAGRSC